MLSSKSSITIETLHKGTEDYKKARQWFIDHSSRVAKSICRDSITVGYILDLLTESEHMPDVMVVGKNNGEICAFGFSRFPPRKDYAFTDLLCSLTSCKGIGSVIMKRLEAVFYAKGRYLHMLCGVDDKPLIQWYQRLGFVLLEDFPPSRDTSWLSKNCPKFISRPPWCEWVDEHNECFFMIKNIGWKATIHRGLRHYWNEAKRPVAALRRKLPSLPSLPPWSPHQSSFSTKDASRAWHGSSHLQKAWSGLGLNEKDLSKAQRVSITGRHGRPGHGLVLHYKDGNERFHGKL